MCPTVKTDRQRCHTVSRGLSVLCGYPIPLHLPIELLPVPADKASRLGLVPREPTQRILDHHLFDGFRTTIAVLVRRSQTRTRSQGRRKIVRRDNGSGREHNQPFDGVLQFTNVSRPVVTAEGVERGLDKSLRRSPLCRAFLEETVN